MTWLPGIPYPSASEPELLQRALSEPGVPLSGAVLDALRTTFSSDALATADKAGARFLHFEARTSAVRDPVFREVMFSLRTPEGKRTIGLSFLEVPRPK